MILKSIEDDTLSEIFKTLSVNLEGYTMKDYHKLGLLTKGYRPVYTLSEISISMEKNINVRKLRKLIKSGLLDAVKCGRTYYVANTEKEKLSKYPTIHDGKDKEVMGYIEEVG